MTYRGAWDTKYLNIILRDTVSNGKMKWNAENFLTWFTFGRAITKYGICELVRRHKNLLDY